MNAIDTLTKIQQLENLYRDGYRSNTVDATVNKLMAIEAASAEKEAESLEQRLHDFESRYGINSDEFDRRFHRGELGDSADMFEWSAYYQMWVTTRDRLRLLKSMTI